MPSGRVPPDAFGISTRRTGCGCRCRRAAGSRISGHGPSDAAAKARRSCRRSPALPCCAGPAPAPSSDCRARQSLPCTVRQCRRAFGGGVRRTGFGPCPEAVAGFTRFRRREGQLELGFLPHGPCENSRPTCPSNRSGLRSADACPTMPSADFCTAISAPRGRLSPEFRTRRQISRGKIDRLHRTPAGFTTPALDDYGLRGHLPARPAG